MIPIQIIAGVGGGLLFEPPMIALQTMVSQDDTATATATFGFVRNLATSFSVVIGGVVFQNGMHLREPKLQAAGLSPHTASLFTGTAAAANVMLISALPTSQQQEVVKEAFAWSLRNMWILYAGVAVCGLVASFFIEKQVLGRHHVETKTGLKEKRNAEATGV
jgi:hypothetical protein